MTAVHDGRHAHSTRMATEAQASWMVPKVSKIEFNCKKMICGCAINNSDYRIGMHFIVNP